MKIFTDEFKNFLKEYLICSWYGHKKGKWSEVYWALAHSAGYQSRFCLVCNKELESNKNKAWDQIKNIGRKTKAKFNIKSEADVLKIINV